VEARILGRRTNDRGEGRHLEHRRMHGGAAVCGSFTNVTSTTAIYTAPRRRRPAALCHSALRG